MARRKKTSRQRRSKPATKTAVPTKPTIPVKKVAFLRPKPTDAIAAVSIPLGVVAMISDQTWVVWAMFSISAIVLSFAVFRHEEASKRLRIALCVLVITGFGYAGLKVTWHNRELELEKNEGVLVAAGEEETSFQKKCTDAPSGSLAIRIGNNFTWTNHVPYVVFRVKGDPMIVLDKKNKGGDLVVETLKIFDDRDDTLVDVRNGRSWVRPDVHKARPDESTLIVYDHLDKEILNLHYVNKNVLSLTGVIRYPGLKAITITENSMFIGNNEFSDGCFGGGGAGYDVW